MKLLTSSILALSTLFASPSPQAAQDYGEVNGEVVLADAGICEFLLIRTAAGYSLVEWLLGSGALEGEKLTGRFHILGASNVRLTSLDQDAIMVVRASGIPLRAALQLYILKCGL